MHDNLCVPCLTRNCWQEAAPGAAYCASCATVRRLERVEPEESSDLWFARLPANQAHYAAVSAALLADQKRWQRAAKAARLATLVGTVLLLTGVLTELAPFVGLGMLALVIAYALVHAR